MSDRLLDQDQLHQEVLEIIEHRTLEENTMSQLIVNLIQQQKKLYADKIISNDVEHTKWFVDITGEYDYYHMVKRPMVEKHKNQLRAEQRKLNNQLSGGDE